ELPTALPRDMRLSAASGTAPEVMVATRVMSPTSYQATLLRDISLHSLVLHYSTMTNVICQPFFKFFWRLLSTNFTVTKARPRTAPPGSAGLISVGATAE